MRSPSPAYDYHSEMDEVLARTEALTDEQKAEVELFDSKFTSLLPMQVQCAEGHLTGAQSRPQQPAEHNIRRQALHLLTNVLHPHGTCTAGFV